MHIYFSILEFWVKFFQVRGGFITIVLANGCFFFLKLRWLQIILARLPRSLDCSASLCVSEVTCRFDLFFCSPLGISPHAL